nr:hypothetical protein [Methanohalophilus profundi]
MSQFCGGEDQDYYKADKFGGQAQGEAAVQYPAVGSGKVLPEGAVLRSPAKLPAQQGPEEGLRALPYTVQQQVDGTGRGQDEQACVFPAHIEKISGQTQRHNKEQGMCKDPAAGKGIGKEHPSYEFVNEVGQYGAYDHVPVVDVSASCGNVEECQGYADVCEGKHANGNSLLMLKRM